MKVRFYEKAEDSLIKYSVIVSRHKGKWVFCKHRERSTFEVPGGHREKGESPLETAERELREETGAIDFKLAPVCVYSVSDETESFGMLYYADISQFEEKLHCEIESVHLFDDIPTEQTYPLIQPKLIEEVIRRGFLT